LIYKVYPLGPDPNLINRYFGSPEAGKREILTHWAASKRLPGGEAINPELMASRPFPYPYSMPALRGVKAAEFQGGMTAHARMYDRLQRAHLVECRNVADPQTIRECAEEIGLDMERFRADHGSEASAAAVMADREVAHALGISGTPTAVFNDKWALSGAVPVEAYRRVIDNLLAGRDPLLAGQAPAAR
ncbi:MAG: DsbA family protein, partial [Chloroflexi bacterium]|nr:DsbA family protein [Chloroflexota bacterium]